MRLDNIPLSSNVEYFQQTTKPLKDHAETLAQVQDKLDTLVFIFPIIVALCLLIATATLYITKRTK